MRLLLLIAFALMSFAIFAGVRAVPNYRELILQTSNNDIAWDGNYFGLYVSEVRAPASRVLALGPACVPYLLEALNDERRFVVAHVLLTQILCDSYSVSGSEWNGLHVTLYADGSTSIPSKEMTKLRGRWASR